MFHASLGRNLADFPEESFARLAVDRSGVEHEFTLLFQTLKELHRMFVPLLLQEVHKHHLEIHPATVFDKANVNLVHKLSSKTLVECIAHIYFVVVRGHAWEADRIHSRLILLIQLAT